LLMGTGIDLFKTCRFFEIKVQHIKAYRLNSEFFFL